MSLVDYIFDFKPTADRRIKASKEKERMFLLAPTLVGLVLGAAGYSIPAKASGSFNPWEAGGAAGVTAIACLVTASLRNQPGTAEASLRMLQAADDLQASAERLKGTLAVTHQKLDGQQAGATAVIAALGRADGKLDACTENIQVFGDRIQQMASTVPARPASRANPTPPQAAYAPEPPPPPVTVKTKAEYMPERLDFAPEGPAQDPPPHLDFARETPGDTRKAVPIERLAQYEQEHAEMLKEKGW